MAGIVRQGPDESRLFTPAFLLLGIADLAYFVAIGIAIYGLPLYVTGPVGSDEAGAGLAFGAFGVTALLCRPFAGRLSDVRGRRLLMIFGAVLCGIGMLLLPFADSLPASSGSGCCRVSRRRRSSWPASRCWRTSRRRPGWARR